MLRNGDNHRVTEATKTPQVAGKEWVIRMQSSEQRREEGPVSQVSHPT
jgi:hypothetical protein